MLDIILSTIWMRHGAVCLKKLRQYLLQFEHNAQT